VSAVSLALTLVIYAAAPAFVARGGIIVNIASSVAISPETLNRACCGSKAFVLALGQSLSHELAGKGVRVQAVLPRATATEFWDIAGLPVRNLPIEIVMSTQEAAEAGPAGLDQRETVTIPFLRDKAERDTFDAAGGAMSLKLSSAVPASLYNIRQPISRSMT
jgi:uncharacterized protein